MSSADAPYETKNEAPSSDVKDDSYVSRTGQNQIPVQSDNKPVEDPINPATADSDETLGMALMLKSSNGDVEC